MSDLLVWSMIIGDLALVIFNLSILWLVKHQGALLEMHTRSLDIQRQQIIQLFAITLGPKQTPQTERE